MLVLAACGTSLTDKEAARDRGKDGGSSGRTVSATGGLEGDAGSSALGATGGGGPGGSAGGGPGGAAGAAGPGGRAGAGGGAGGGGAAAKQVSTGGATDGGVTPAPLGWRSGPPKYYAQKYGPQVITKTAFFYAQVGAAVALANEQRRVYEANGFHVVYSRGIPPNDNNQTADVVQMRQAGVRAIAFQGDVVALTKLVNAMRQQNFSVDLLNLGNAVYDANTFKLTSGDAMKG